MEKIKVGLIGFGTIGSGVVNILGQRRSLIAERTGIDIELAAICDSDLERPRPVSLPAVPSTTDYREITDNPDIRIVVELVGGIEPALAMVTRALEKGKSVVTANKALLSEKGDLVMETAAARECHLGFEASVCGAIPLIRGIRDGLVADTIVSLHGILNGTTNFILTRMGEENLSLDDALEIAREKGYAEREADLDLSGRDSGHKISILAALVTGRFFPASTLKTEGISGITSQDIAYAAELGYTIKLVSLLKYNPQGDARPGNLSAGPCVATYPALVPNRHLLASVRDVNNAVHFSGQVAGEGLFYGKGAGMMPTAGSVVSDIVTIGRRVLYRVPPARPWVPGARDGMSACGEEENRYYLRFNALDRPGVFARIAEILGKHDIGIASCIQKEEKPRHSVPVVMTTHLSLEKNVSTALSQIARLPVIAGSPVSLRIVLDDENTVRPQT